MKKLVLITRRMHGVCTGIVQRYPRSHEGAVKIAMKYMTKRNAIAYEFKADAWRFHDIVKGDMVDVEIVNRF